MEDSTWRNRVGGLTAALSSLLTYHSTPTLITRTRTKTINNPELITDKTEYQFKFDGNLNEAWSNLARSLAKIIAMTPREDCQKRAKIYLKQIKAACARASRTGSTEYIIVLTYRRLTLKILNKSEERTQTILKLKSACDSSYFIWQYWTIVPVDREGS